MRAARGPLLAFAAFGAYWGAFGVLVPDLKEQADASVTELGIAFLAVALAALPAMVVTGRIVDRVGPRILPLTLVFFAAAGLRVELRRGLRAGAPKSGSGDSFDSGCVSGSSTLAAGDTRAPRSPSFRRVTSTAPPEIRLPMSSSGKSAGGAAGGIISSRISGPSPVSSAAPGAT